MERCDILREIDLSTVGPVAQLGARFHGMEEVVSSNLTRSTKFSKTYSTTLAYTVVDARA